MFIPNRKVEDRWERLKKWKMSPTFLHHNFGVKKWKNVQKEKTQEIVLKSLVGTKYCA